MNVVFLTVVQDDHDVKDGMVVDIRPEPEIWTPEDALAFIDDPEGKKPTGFDQMPFYQQQIALDYAAETKTLLEKDANTLVAMYKAIGRNLTLKEVEDAKANAARERAQVAANGATPGFGHMELKLWAPIMGEIDSLDELKEVLYEEADISNPLERKVTSRRRLVLDYDTLPQFSGPTKGKWRDKQQWVPPNKGIAQANRVRFSNMKVRS